MPKYPSTDLAYCLAPNGHGGGPGLDDLYESSQGHETATPATATRSAPRRRATSPGCSGSAVEGLLREGLRRTPRSRYYGDCEGRINFTSWNARTDAGDPTSPRTRSSARSARGLTEFRGAYYQDEGWEQQLDSRKVAVFSIQGWTDDLFEAVESFRMFKYLKRLDPKWPVEVVPR